jgi:hypothetical protein
VNQKRTKVFGALGALAATAILCLGVSCSQTIPDPPKRPAVAPSTITLAVNPANATVTEGNGIDPKFTVTIDGAAYPAPTFLWEVQAPGTTTWVTKGDSTSMFTWYAPVAADSGSMIRCTATNSAGSITTATPVTLTVNPKTLPYTPPTPPAVGDILVVDALKPPASSTIDLAPNSSYGWANNYTIPTTPVLTATDTLTFVIEGTSDIAIPADGLKIMPINRGTGSGWNEMALWASEPVVAGPVAAGTKFTATTDIPITKNGTLATDTMLVQIGMGTGTQTATAHLSLTSFSIWIKPTPPKPGQTLLYSDSNHDVSLLVNSQYGWSYQASIATPPIFAVGDSLTIVIAGNMVDHAITADNNGLQFNIFRTNSWLALHDWNADCQIVPATASGVDFTGQIDMAIQHATIAGDTVAFQLDNGTGTTGTEAPQTLHLSKFQIWK